MGRFIAGAALVLVLAALIRVTPIASESFHYDAIVHQMAAREGIVANAFEDGNAYRLRRFHPPLLSYIITANNAILGEGAFRSRVFSILFGALACLLVAVAVGRVAGLRRSAAGAVYGGLLLTLLPVHLYVSRTANWDAVYSAFLVASLLALAAHAAAPSGKKLALASVLGALAFLTCELGLALVPAFGAVFLMDAQGSERRVRWWLPAILAAAATVTVLWPAGVAELDIVRTLRFRVFDSSTEARNAPWTEFYVELYRQAPVFVVALVGAVLMGLVNLVRREHLTGGSFAALIPFFVYALTAFALSTQQRLVYLHHIADLFPPLCVLMGVGFAWWLRSARGVERILAVLWPLVVVAGMAMAAKNPDPNVVGPQEHPGLISIGKFLEEHPGSRTYFHYTSQMEYYAPGAMIERSPRREWDGDAIATAKVGRYDFVISDASMFGDFISNPDELGHLLAPHYALERELPHRRTGETVAWIYSRQR